MPYAGGLNGILGRLAYRKKETVCQHHCIQVIKGCQGLELKFVVPMGELIYSYGRCRHKSLQGNDYTHLDNKFSI